MPDQLRFGSLGAEAVHLCIDMQTLFAERTDWHVPWIERVLPKMEQLSAAHPDRNVFTRFVTPQKAEDAKGSWRRYYDRWANLTGEVIEPRLIELVPSLKRMVPPGMVVDKQHYSPFVEPVLHEHLQQRGIETLVISGSETDVCVLSTVLGAVDLGYRVIIASDALCSVSDESHDALLTLYRNRFGQQIEAADVDTIIEAWH